MRFSLRSFAVGAGVSLALSVAAGPALGDALSGTSAQGAGTFQPTSAAGEPQTITPGVTPRLDPTASSSSTSTITTGTSTTGVSTTAGVAQPDVFSSCDSLAVGNFCLWSNANYSGTFWYHTATGSNSNQWNYVGAAQNDQASSLYNHRANVTLVSRYYPPQGEDEVCLGAEAAYNNLTNDDWPDGSGVNDTISAYDFLGSGTC